MARKHNIRNLIKRTLEYRNLLERMVSTNKELYSLEKKVAGYGAAKYSELGFEVEVSKDGGIQIKEITK